MRLIDELEWRGLLHQVTADELGDRLEAGPITLYNGFDPSGASLHVGHLVPVMLLKHFQRRGHRVIALTGGGTGLIGDPSGKSAERNLLDRAQVDANAGRIGGQLLRLLADPANPPLHADNIEWLAPMGLLEFLRDVGKHFSINAMIAKDSVKLRLEREGEGISFTEFSYALLQARDFLELYRRHDCILQCGGSDQWGNIVSGTDLIRRVEGGRAYGLTVPLLTDTEGNKFGKTEQGTSCFLDPALTSPYQFYQFWINADDADVARLLKLFTFLEPARIEALAATAGSPAREAQKALAYEVTAFVHGAGEADKARTASQQAFSDDLWHLSADELEQVAEVPRKSIRRSSIGSVSFAELLNQLGAAKSKSEARRLIEQGGVTTSTSDHAAKRLEGFDPRVEASHLIDERFLILKTRRFRGLVKVED
jgi:tyrosyl-tRNA synthetase